MDIMFTKVKVIWKKVLVVTAQVRQVYLVQMSKQEEIVVLTEVWWTSTIYQLHLSAVSINYAWLHLMLMATVWKHKVH